MNLMFHLAFSFLSLFASVFAYSVGGLSPSCGILAPPGAERYDGSNAVDLKKFHSRFVCYAFSPSFKIPEANLRSLTVVGAKLYFATGSIYTARRSLAGEPLGWRPTCGTADNFNLSRNFDKSLNIKARLARVEWDYSAQKYAPVPWNVVLARMVNLQQGSVFYSRLQYYEVKEEEVAKQGPVAPEGEALFRGNMYAPGQEALKAEMKRLEGDISRTCDWKI